MALNLLISPVLNPHGEARVDVLAIVSTKIIITKTITKS
ncbi:hypothetical protein [Burkholderia glumae]|nr:hypothetical protein B7760_04300 [Burkholderia glumae]